MKDWEKDAYRKTPYYEALANKYGEEYADASIGHDTSLGGKSKVKKYARVPAGTETCGFCIMLASRGFVYGSDVDARHAHPGCDCSIVPGFQGETVVEGYDPDALYDIYVNARASLPSDDVLYDMYKAEIDDEQDKRKSFSYYIEKKTAAAIRERAEFANCRSTQTYLDTLKVAKSTVVPEARWRVELPESVEAFRSSHKGLLLHTSKGGSTVAVDKTGDIVAVCKNVDSNERGSDLIQLAVKNGGTKLDSYSGNHIFYCKNGFEPVSWCEWEDEHKPPDWEYSFNREQIIFYVYTGKRNEYNSLDEFLNSTEPSRDYDTAYKVRDSRITGGVEN